jgi:hypothetical protein
MGSVYHENVHQIVELCCELLTLVQNACISESREGGSILAYAGICDCASRIRMSAEERRHDLARAQWKHALGGKSVGSPGIVGSRRLSDHEARAQKGSLIILTDHEGQESASVESD